MNRSIPTPSTPVVLAGQAAQAVRELNHATAVGGDGYRHPADLAATLAELATLAHRLPQAVEQAAQWLTREATGGRLGLDDVPGSQPAAVAAVVGALQAHLRNAGALAGDVAEALDEAGQIAAHLTGGAR